MSAWTVIGHTEVGSGGAAWITFSSIPATYDDLVIMWTARAEGTEDQGRIKFNDSTSNFTYRYLEGTGTGTTSATGSVAFLAHVNWAFDTASTFSNAYIYIPNYASSNAKPFSVDSVVENNASNGYQAITTMLWNNTAAITKIELGLASDELAQYSSATLYGITKGSSGGVTVS